MKLTPAQRAFLNEIVRKGHETCVESYSPAKKLVALGLATYRSGTFGQGRVEATDAGRAAVSSGNSDD